MIWDLTEGGGAGRFASLSSIGNRPSALVERLLAKLTNKITVDC